MGPQAACASRSPSPPPVHGCPLDAAHHLGLAGEGREGRRTGLATREGLRAPTSSGASVPSFCPALRPLGARRGSASGSGSGVGLRRILYRKLAWEAGGVARDSRAGPARSEGWQVGTPQPSRGHPQSRAAPGTELLARPGASICSASGCVRVLGADT